MSILSFAIRSGDYAQGGSASKGLKEQLKKIGAAPEIIRRVMIAAYEAEMNVVIHSVGGRMTVALDEEKADIEVCDDGPGIPDIEQAMKEGFSTAPAAARELGFGAGLGLPNIKKNSDYLTIESQVGKGTSVKFRILLRPQALGERMRNSLHIAPAGCRGCYHCLFACPTRALRVRGNHPEVRSELCIDCSACISACRTGALTVLGTVGQLPPGEGRVLVVPPALLSQFGPVVGRVLDSLAELGYRDIRVTQAWEDALRGAVMLLANQVSQPRPVISPCCPAAVNLVAARFPSLIGHVAPFVSPLEAVRDSLVGKRAVFVACCPAQRTALDVGRLDRNVEIIVPSVLCNAVMPLAMSQRGGVSWRDSSLQTGETSHQTSSDMNVMRVTGMQHVVNVLEKVEDGRMNDVTVLELAICDEGCFGSPLLGEDPFIARQRWVDARRPADVGAMAVRRKMPLVAKAGLRLDNDMSKAIDKLAKIDILVKSLPRKDCGLCGCPTCVAFAEDMILGKASRADCAFFHEGTEHVP